MAYGPLEVHELHSESTQGICGFVLEDRSSTSITLSILIFNCTFISSSCPYTVFYGILIVIGENTGYKKLEMHKNIIKNHTSSSMAHYNGYEAEKSVSGPQGQREFGNH